MHQQGMSHGRARGATTTATARADNGERGSTTSNKTKNDKTEADERQTKEKTATTTAD